jgi:hypothetical protein
MSTTVEGARAAEGERRERERERERDLTFSAPSSSILLPTKELKK